MLKKDTFATLPPLIVIAVVLMSGVIVVLSVLKTQEQQYQQKSQPGNSNTSIVLKDDHKLSLWQRFSQVYCSQAQP